MVIIGVFNGLKKFASDGFIVSKDLKLISFLNVSEAMFPHKIDLNVP